MQNLEMVISYINLIDHFQLAFRQPIFIVYVASVIVDLILGNVKAWVQGDVDSDVGIKGTVKHLGVFSFVVILLPPLSYYLGTSSVSIAIETYLVYQYAISIIENLGMLGFKVPKIFEENIRRLGDKDYVDVSKKAKVEMKQKDLAKKIEKEKGEKDDE